MVDLVEEIQNLERSITNLDNINSEQDLWVIKGQLRIINFILSLDTCNNPSVGRTPRRKSNIIKLHNPTRAEKK